MNELDEQWKKLARVARQTPNPTPMQAPPGFAGRVFARRDSGAGPQLALLWESWAMRTLAFAALVMLVSLSANYNLVRDQFSPGASTPDVIEELMLEP